MVGEKERYAVEWRGGAAGSKAWAAETKGSGLTGIVRRAADSRCCWFNKTSQAGSGWNVWEAGDVYILNLALLENLESGCGGTGRIGGGVVRWL